MAAGTPQRRLGRGYTLVELLIACTVVALLAAVALPSYRWQVQRAQRADAAAALLRVELAQASHHAHHGLYTADLRALGQRSGLSAEGRYRIEIAEVRAAGYTARAVPVDMRVQQGDGECAVLTLEVEQLHTRRGPAARCWGG